MLLFHDLQYCLYQSTKALIYCDNYLSGIELNKILTFTTGSLVGPVSADSSRALLEKPSLSNSFVLSGTGIGNQIQVPSRVQQ